MQRMRIFLLSCTVSLLQAAVAQAQNLNSTEIVYASTFVPFDSSFSVSPTATTAFATFPSGYKRTSKHRLDSVRRVCSSQDLNGDGDVTDSGEQIHERFYESYSIGFIINNHSREPVTIDYLQYQVEGVNGRVITSSKAPPTKPVVVPAKKDAAVLFQFTESTGTGRRRFLGQSRPIPTRLTRRRVTYTVKGHSKTQRSITLLHKDIVSFSDINHCPK
jgi:hypothetical protein